jgi:hypothetical protein
MWLECFWGRKLGKLKVGGFAHVLPVIDKDLGLDFGD